MATPKFALDEVVFAKMKGYPPWPAKVEFFENIPSRKQIKYNVYFYGTNQIAQCKEDDLFPYLMNRDKFGKPKKAKGFVEAISQADSEVQRQSRSLLAINNRPASPLEYLKSELQVLKIDKEIKSSLNKNKPHYDTCLHLLEEYSTLYLTQLMFIKNPLLIDTLLKLQVYSSNVNSGSFPDQEDSDEFKMYLIRKKASDIYIRVQAVFIIPQGRQFLELFTEKLEEFKVFVENMSEDDALQLSRDPWTCKTEGRW